MPRARVPALESGTLHAALLEVSSGSTPDQAAWLTFLLSKCQKLPVAWPCALPRLPVAALLAALVPVAACAGVGRGL